MTPDQLEARLTKIEGQIQAAKEFAAIMPRLDEALKLRGNVALISASISAMFGALAELKSTVEDATYRIAGLSYDIRQTQSMLAAQSQPKLVRTREE